MRSRLSSSLIGFHMDLATMQMESHWEIMLEENRELLDYMLSGSGALAFSVDFFLSRSSRSRESRHGRGQLPSLPFRI